MTTIDYQSQLETQLVQIKIAISGALSNPRPNWRVGQVWMDHSDYISMLFKQQDMLIASLKKVPSESIDTSQNWITEFGVDMNSYHDEEF